MTIELKSSLMPTELPNHLLHPLLVVDGKRDEEKLPSKPHETPKISGSTGRSLGELQ